MINQLAAPGVFNHQRDIRRVRIARINFQGFFDEREGRLPVPVSQSSGVIDQSAR